MTWRERNNSDLILKGLRARFAAAKFPRHVMFLLSAMWDAMSLPMRPIR